MDKANFIKEITNYYGEYKKPLHTQKIYEYIDKYIDENKLKEIYWFVLFYYHPNTNPMMPPLISDIDYSIRTAVKENRGNDPFKKQKFANEYDYNILQQNIEKPEAIKESMTEFKNKLVDKLKSNKKTLTEDDGIYHGSDIKNIL